jgi:hypothetical protein
MPDTELGPTKDTWWVFLLAPVVATAAAGVRDWWVQRKTKARAKVVRQELRSLRRVYEILSNLCSDSGVSRAVILVSHNGGTTPSPSSPAYVSCIAEEVARGVPRIREAFQRVPFDADYARLFQTAAETASFRLGPAALASLPGLESGATEVHRLGFTRDGVLVLLLAGLPDPLPDPAGLQLEVMRLRAVYRSDPGVASSLVSP